VHGSNGLTAGMSELQDLSALIRANTPLIIIETQDEGRVVELFRQTLMHVWRALHRWSITEGACAASTWSARTMRSARPMPAPPCR